MTNGSAPSGRPGDRGPGAADGAGGAGAGAGRSAGRSDPEVVLAQALRAMAGGARVSPAEPFQTPHGRSGTGSTAATPWLTTGQVVLLALLVGLVLGTAAGIVSLLG